MTASALIILAEGFEETEAVVPIDLLRRAQVHVTIAGLTNRTVKSARGIEITTDTILSGQENFDLLILPGGQPGTTNLCTSTRVLELVRKSFEQKKLVGAICAAPLVLSKAGVLTNKNITCFPGTPISDQTVTIQNNPVVIDGQLVTSKGMGTSIAFALALVERTTNSEIAQKIGQSIQYYSSN